MKINIVNHSLISFRSKGTEGRSNPAQARHDFVEDNNLFDENL